PLRAQSECATVTVTYPLRPPSAAALPCLGLILLLWSQGPGVQGQEFRFGPCRVEGVVLQELWEAFWDMKDVVQAQDNVTSVRLLRKEILQNVSEAESCYFIHSLLKFYLNTIFKNYHAKAVKFRILRSFSTLANNFALGLGPISNQENEMFSISENARRRFLLFQGAFKQLDREAALTKAFGEMDILLTWMQKFYQP
uniref:Interleukin 24 n=1 Tax=Catagonus wagneri TaxID=51154 RepID=A0A8C3VMJ9_9CETA